mgnify:CR=1 FL=1|tara:strand:+ start:405 stop:593 length:189 start_codon:yes stop_codon:yes gene_type:complete
MALKPIIEMSNKEIKTLIKHHNDCLNTLNKEIEYRNKNFNNNLSISQNNFVEFEKMKKVFNG